MDEQYKTDNWLGNPVEPYSKFELAHINSIETCCFNPDNETEFVTGSHDRTIKTWDMTKFK
jgi:WD40 repeat protein